MTTNPLPRSGAGAERTLAILDAMWAVSHGLEARSKWMRRVYRITGPQRLVVRLIGREPGIGAGDLARNLHVHPSTLTGVLRRLEASGMIRRVADPVDGRRARFHLTAAGVRIDKLRTGTVESAVDAVLRKTRPGEHRAALALLRALAGELDRTPAGRRLPHSAERPWNR